MELPIKKKVLVVFALVFIGIQFYRPNKNEQLPETLDDFLIAEKAPKNIKSLIKNSCYNCHSNNTNYFWYDHIAPASWFVDNHIKEAREHLNFSNWATLDSRDRAGMVSEIAVNILEEKMPLPSYVTIHSDAKLSESNKQKILEWLYTID
ncbi:heme-binding domain-containing protein [Psychroserpens jangbogonensis]|uniref:heme-binding domain-containing protein n=1 Tax=Psychroserpens jangbogonensis TaxID=1484460 RepID=UPI00053DB508|nr:heme-binding domain-containing protein [Psychroserpens jangbogonensis]